MFKQTDKDPHLVSEILRERPMLYFHQEIPAHLQSLTAGT